MLPDLHSYVTTCLIFTEAKHGFERTAFLPASQPVAFPVRRKPLEIFCTQGFHETLRSACTGQPGCFPYPVSLSDAAPRDLLAASFPDGAEQEVDSRLQGLPFPEQLCLVQKP